MQTPQVAASISLTTKIDEIDNRQKRMEKHILSLTQNQKEASIMCKSMLQILKKQEKTNIDQYKVSTTSLGKYSLHDFVINYASVYSRLILILIYQNYTAALNIEN